MIRPTRTPRFRFARTTRAAVFCRTVTLAFLAACADGTRSAPTAPSTPPTARAAAMNQAPLRPIEGRCESVLEPFPDPLPLKLPQRVTGTCQLAHLGRVTYDFVHVIDFTASPITFTTTTLTFTAANGDVLRAPGVGFAFPNAAGFAVSGTYTFAGGTGRFTNATGYVNFVGQAAVPAFTATLTLDGEIAYDASDRGGR
jgi:hypothetical protein